MWRAFGSGNVVKILIMYYICALAEFALHWFNVLSVRRLLVLLICCSVECARLQQQFHFETTYIRLRFSSLVPPQIYYGLNDFVSNERWEFMSNKIRISFNIISFLMTIHCYLVVVVVGKTEPI